jgi:SAM-dependent methyltransferase
MNDAARTPFAQELRRVLGSAVELDGNFASRTRLATQANQQHTNTVFSDKWERYEQSDEKSRLYRFQLDWYLKLYGFGDEATLARHLADCRVIFDAGCGLGYKAEWFARLAPHALVIGMDFSDAARQAAANYASLPNLFFLQGDIASTGFAAGTVDYVSCDQVIMHTEVPEKTFMELARIARPGGQVACYFYAKKALPRELLDDYFRVHCQRVGREELWEMSEQLTELGRRLSELKVSIDAPDIPLLGIKGGRVDVQRFIYWNFLKCFWNPELGHETSVVTNFDWYSPSNARRFSEAEVRGIVQANGLDTVFWHAEEACYSGRFRRP